MIEANAAGAGGNGAMFVAICLTGGVGRPEPKIVELFSRSGAF